MTHRLRECIVDPLVAWMLHHRQSRYLDRPRIRCLAACQDCLKPHLRVRIVCRHCQPLNRLGQAILPTANDACRESSRPVVFRAQYAPKQLRLHRLDGRTKSQCLELMPFIRFVVVFQSTRPTHRRLADLRRIAFPQLKLDLLARPALGRLQLLQQFVNGFSNNLRLGCKWTALDTQTPDSAMMQVARRIAEVVVLMADDRVVKVGDVNRAVRTNADVHRSKVPVARLEHRLLPVKFEAGTGRRQREAAHGVRLVIVQHKLAAHRLRHVPAIDHLHATVAPGIADTVEPQSVLRGNRCRREIRNAARAIDDQRLAPVVKHNAPRIPRPHEIVEQPVELQTTGSQSIHPRLVKRRHPPRCFHP